MDDLAQAPELLGPYRMLRLLGEGGSGAVYLAERTDFEQRVAVKRFHSSFVTAGLLGSENEERDLLVLLDHPNIVRLIDYANEPGGTRYLVMEYIAGEPVTAYADAKQLTQRERLSLLLPVLDAVEYAHQRFLVHGDLKPANVLVTSEGVPKLLDFGTAGRAGSKARGYTAGYASHEQLAGEELSIASDVLALGVMARELIATPIRGDLQAVLRKAVAPLPTERYLSVQAFHDDLAHFLRHEPVTARSSRRTERIWLWAQRHQLGAAMLTLLLLAVILGVSGVAWQSAVAGRQKRLAETRLHDLVRLNGTLEGELYSSSAKLPRSGPARQSLLHGATQTLDSLAKDNEDDGLALELADQYGKLAELETAWTGDGGSGVPEARRDLVKAKTLLVPLRRTAQHDAENTRLAEIERRLPAQ